MTHVTDDRDARRVRWSLFVRSQVPLLVAVAGLLSLTVMPGLQISSPGLAVVGLEIILLPTIAALVLPWERLPRAAQSVLALVDLVGVAVLAVAMNDALHHMSLLAAFPAVWLGLTGRAWGAAVGILGAFATTLAPLLLTPGHASAHALASAFVDPIVVSVLVVSAVVMTGRLDRATAQQQEAFEERNRATAESERIGAVMRSFADEIDLGFVYLDAEGGEPFYNHAVRHFGELAGQDATSGVGTHVYGDDQVTRVPPEEQMIPRLRRGEVIAELLHWVGPPGRQRALLGNGRPVRRPDGRPAGSMLIVQDVTELLRAERSREDALATLAHELRTPLTSIIGYADLLEADDLPPAASSGLRVIARNAEHLLDLTTAFLNGLHRGPEIRRERVPMRDLVSASLEVLRTIPGADDRDIEVDVPERLHVAADVEGMTTVLHNLLNNAVKFSSPGDRIRLAAGKGDRNVWLTVHNTGPGIDRPDLERIFDRFYRGRNAQRGAVPGTGIGLSVSRDIVAAHGGSLTAQPVEDGACFRLTLPPA